MESVQELPRLLYRVSEVSAMTALSESYVYELIASGALPSLRVGRSVRVPAEWLGRWIDEQIKAQGD